MAKVQLFANWTWKISLPEPFDKSTSVSTDYYSTYCNVATKKSTLHSSLLSAVLAYMEMDTSLTPGSSSESAIGTQGDKVVAEYQSRTGEIHVVVFNKKNGKFNVGRFDSVGSSPKVYSLKDGGNLGTALFFALMPEALRDDEFREHYDILGACKNDGYTDMEKAEKSAFILCDNLYRRIESADTLPTAGIKLIIPTTGNIPQLTAVNLSRNAYSPSSVLFGTFRILTGTAAPAAAVIVNRDDFVKHYPLSDRVLTPKEELMVPRIEDWYVIPPEVTTICQHAQMTTAGSQPMRNFMMRGPAGTGKTEGAKAIAAGLGLPYLYYTCSANTEIYDFLGQMLPETDEKPQDGREYPTLTDIQMDPPSAYKKLTGIYDEAITDAEVYDKLLEVMAQDAKALMEDNASGQRFRYVETPLITAIRNGYVIEIQEPTVIANPGVLVGLNALLDRCASVTLTTGEVIHRHPDTVVVVTTNNNYAGCRDMNQSVISRMNLIMDMDEPDVDTLTERTMKVTGCTDRTAVSDMAASIQEISERCRETMITDGSCGVRELISWVQSFMVCGSIMEAAKYTVLSSVSSDPENRADILTSCLEQKFAA
ncbi:MAG: ATP-binding protein [Lachnospiraceae bacterium]|nr:ATP-binding protein [Muribaculum sp.]MCM1409859.1 ATP-binding protein [Lachnospiraceae bacterium]